MLSVKKLIYKILQCPHVVESGTSGSWTYRKWSDGTAECWRTFTSGAFSPTTSVGGFYGRALTGNAFPTGLFISVPVVSYNCDSWGNGFFWGNIYALTKDSFSVLILRNDNASSAYQASVYAVGKWQ